MKNFDQLVLFDSILSMKWQSSQASNLTDVQVKNILVGRIKQLDPSLNLQTFLLQQQSLFSRIQNAIDLQSDSQIIMLIIKLFKQINLQKIQSSFDFNQLYAKVALNDPSTMQIDQNQPNMSQLRQMNAMVNVNSNMDYLVGEIQYLKQSLSVLKQFYVGQCQGQVQYLDSLYPLVNKLGIMNAQKGTNINNNNDLHIQQLQLHIDKLNSEKHNILNSLNKQIQDLKVELSTKDDRIEQLEQQIAEKDSQIQRINKQALENPLIDTTRFSHSPKLSDIAEQSVQSLNANKQLNALNKSIADVVQENLLEKKALQQQISTIEDQYQKLQYECSLSNLKATQAQANAQDLMHQVQKLRDDKEKLQKYLHFCMLSYQRRYNEKMNIKISDDDSLLSEVEENSQEVKQKKKFSEKQMQEFGAIHDECEALRKQVLQFQDEKAELFEQASALQLKNANLEKENAKLIHHLEQKSIANIDLLKQKQLQTQLDVLEHHNNTQAIIVDNLRAEHSAAMERLEKLDIVKNTQEKVIQSLQQNFNASLSLITRQQEQIVQCNKNISSYTSEITMVVQNQINMFIEEQKVLFTLIQQLYAKLTNDAHKQVYSNQPIQDYYVQPQDTNQLNKVLSEITELKGNFYASLDSIQQNRQLLMNQNAILSQLNLNKTSQTDKEQKLMIKNLDSALQQAKSNKEQILQQLLNIVKIIKDNDEVFQQLRLEFAFLDEVYKAIKYTGRIAQ